MEGVCRFADVRIGQNEEMIQDAPRRCHLVQRSYESDGQG